MQSGNVRFQCQTNVKTATLKCVLFGSSTGTAWLPVLLILLCLSAISAQRSHTAMSTPTGMPLPKLVTGVYPPSTATPLINPKAKFDVRQFGAVGDGRFNCTASFQTAINTAAEWINTYGCDAGAAAVVVTGGHYLIGEILLASNVYLYVEADGVVLGSANIADYMAHQWIANNPAVIRCIGQFNTGVIGNGGTLDGQAVPLFISSYNRADDRFLPIQWQGLGPGPQPCADECRPRLLQFERCDQVCVRDVNLQNSADWTSHYRGCNNVYVGNVTITGDHRFPNNDAIDIDSSRNVTVEDITISTGDDAVCPKSTTSYGPLDNLLVQRIKVASRSGAFKIGSATQEDISNILVRDFDIVSPTNRALGIQHRDGGAVCHVYFENVRAITQFAPTGWWGSAEAISVTTLPRSDDSSPVGPIFNLTFSNFTAVSENGASFASVRGAPPIVDVHLQNVKITLTRTNQREKGVIYSGPQLDYRPAAEPQLIPITFENVLWLDGVQNVSVDGLALGIFDNVAHDSYLNEGVCVNGTDPQQVKEIQKNFLCQIIPTEAKMISQIAQRKFQN